MTLFLLCVLAIELCSQIISHYFAFTCSPLFWIYLPFWSSQWSFIYFPKFNSGVTSSREVSQPGLSLPLLQYFYSLRYFYSLNHMYNLFFCLSPLLAWVYRGHDYILFISILALKNKKLFKQNKTTCFQEKDTLHKIKITQGRSYALRERSVNIFCGQKRSQLTLKFKRRYADAGHIQLLSDKMSLKRGLSFINLA